MAKDLNFQKIYALHRYLKKAKMAHVRLPAHCDVVTGSKFEFSKKCCILSLWAYSPCPIWARDPQKVQKGT